MLVTDFQTPVKTITLLLPDSEKQRGKTRETKLKQKQKLSVHWWTNIFLMVESAVILHKFKETFVLFVCWWSKFQLLEYLDCWHCIITGKTSSWITCLSCLYVSIHFESNYINFEFNYVCSCTSVLLLLLFLASYILPPCFSGNLKDLFLLCILSSSISILLYRQNALYCPVFGLFFLD